MQGEPSCSVAIRHRVQGRVSALANFPKNARGSQALGETENLVDSNAGHHFIFGTEEGDVAQVMLSRGWF